MTQDTGSFLLEIGCEDLPDWTGQFLADRWLPAVRRALDASRLPCGQMRLFCTPRRIVLTGEGIPSAQPDCETEIVGPPAAVAVGADGRFTQAAVKFARARGALESSLRVVEKNGKKFVAATRQEKGIPAQTILARVIPETLGALEIPRGMRWTGEMFRFIRPIRWVCALWNNALLDIAVAGVRSSLDTFGHRVAAPGRVAVSGIPEYFAVLENRSVLVREDDRKRHLAQLIGKATGSAGGVEDADIGETVRFVEYPCLEVGEIPESFSGLPEEVVRTVVRKLKGIPLAGTRRFLIVTDGVSGAGIRAHYEAVLAARLQDAAFFMEQDGRKRLADFGEELARILYHPRWGSVKDRVHRLADMAGLLAGELRLPEETGRHLTDAARLCKNDLATLMVAEFPGLQGTIGRIYASREGLPAEVCRAIEEHYWPRSAGGRLPETTAGTLLAVIERIEFLCCFLAEGVEKVGSADPFGLRRAGTGVIEIIWGRRLRLPLRRLVRHAVGLLGAAGETEEAVMTFLRQRTDNLLAATSIPAGLRRGVLAAAGDDFLAVQEKAFALRDFLADAEHADILVPFSRVANILLQAAGRGEQPSALREDLLTEDAEKDLCARVRGEAARLRRLHDEGRYLDFLSELRTWKVPVDRFFDDVLVMSPRPEIRANRLALLAAINDIFLLFADFSQITAEDARHAERT